MKRKNLKYPLSSSFFAYFHHPISQGNIVSGTTISLIVSSFPSSSSSSLVGCGLYHLSPPTTLCRILRVSLAGRHSLAYFLRLFLDLICTRKRGHQEPAAAADEKEAGARSINHKYTKALYKILSSWNANLGILRSTSSV